MNALRKRLLYDLPLIPVPQQGELSAARSYPEIRVIWNGALMEVIAARGAVSIGHADAADIVVDESVWDEPLHQLITMRDGVVALMLSRAMKGRIYTPECSREVGDYIDEQGEELVLERGCGAVLEFGPVTLAIRMTGREKVRPAALLEQVDTALVSLFLFVFAVGMVLINSIIETPPIEADFVTIQKGDIWVRETVAEVPVEKIEPVKKIVLKKNIEGIADATQTRKSLGEAGRVGSKTSTVANTQGSSQRGQDEKVAVSSGIMGVLKNGAQSFDRIFGGGGLGVGMEKTLGSVTGITGVDQFGSGGLGTIGFGTGGGGNHLGIGGTGAIGRNGSGNRAAMIAIYSEKANTGDKLLSSIDAEGKSAVVMGSLDRALIDSYIRRNLAKIRWCYERELARDQSLNGKISILFKINGDGTVGNSNVKRSTMQSEPVETCVASTIKKIHFPAPKGGGIVVVTYPFVFKNAAN